MNTYDLSERTLAFASEVRAYLRSLPLKSLDFDDCYQLVRSSGSVGANYIEANESLGDKDFLMHMKICKKEAKESIYWLRLLNVSSSETTKKALIIEATELMKIFGSIVSRHRRL